MSTLKVGGIRGVSASSDAITVANDGTCTANITSVGGAQLSNRNLCINGADMMVAQRGTSTTGLQNAGGIFTIDRFSHRRNGTWSNAQFKHEQVDSGTGLFKKALKVTCTTAEGSVPAGDEGVFIGHYLEKQDTVAAFGDGSAEAKSFTISFYVKASIATTYVLHLTTHHLSTNKLIYKTFVVNSADTWERKTITFPAITNSISTLDGTVADNAMGYQIHWILDSAPGTKAVDTYQSGTGTYQMPTGVATTGFSNTLNATFQLSGVQIEAGTVATDLEHRSLAQELALCQRYFYAHSGQGVNGSTPNPAPDTNINTASCQSTSGVSWNLPLPVPMRTVPSISSTVTGSTRYRLNSAGANTNSGSDPTLNTVLSTHNVVSGDLGGFSGLSAGQAGNVRRYQGTGILGFSAEL